MPAYEPHLAGPNGLEGFCFEGYCTTARSCLCQVLVARTLCDRPGDMTFSGTWESRSRDRLSAAHDCGRRGGGHRAPFEDSAQTGSDCFSGHRPVPICSRLSCEPDCHSTATSHRSSHTSPCLHPNLAAPPQRRSTRQAESRRAFQVSRAAPEKSMITERQ